MRFRQPHCKRAISLSLLAFLGLLWTQPVLAGSDFGAGWQPKPLTDTNAPAPVKTQAQPSSAKPAQPPVQPDLEARLKPVEPFVKEVENRLTLTPKPGATMVQRLNDLQAVLFGAQQYQDAGQLITKLAEIFPQEAQKAQAEMEKQFQSSMQANAPANSAGNGVKTNKTQAFTPASGMQPAIANAAPSSSANQPKPKKKKRGFWDTDDFGSDFDNDPFFQDTFQGRAKTSMTQGASASTSGYSQQQNYNQQPYAAQANTQQQSAGPSRLATVAQGLAGIALAVGGIAGAYYLNNKMGGSKGYNTPGYNPYASGAYGNPYGYAPYGYGVTPYAPYGTMTSVVPYGGNASMMPYQTSPYVAPGYGAVPFGAMGQTYSYAPYGSSQTFSNTGISGSSFGMGSLGLPNF